MYINFCYYMYVIYDMSFLVNKIMFIKYNVFFYMIFFIFLNLMNFLKFELNVLIMLYVIIY